jgi:hypothetical protein
MVSTTIICLPPPVFLSTPDIRSLIERIIPRHRFPIASHTDRAHRRDAGRI